MMDDEGDDDDHPPCHDKYRRSVLCVPSAAKHTQN